MTTSSTTWRIPPWAWAPIGIAVVAEAVSNALRAYGLGMHLDRFTLAYQGYQISLAGWVLVLAAVAVSLSQARAAWVALTPGAARQRIVAGLAAVLLLTISVTAMASHILEAQRAKVADEGTERSQYDRTLEAYGKAAVELKELADVRTIAAVRAAMDAAPVSRTVFRRTKECTDVTREDSFEACKPILDLRQEMAKSIRKQELEREVADLNLQLSKLDRPEEVQDVEAEVSRGWAWIMGLGVVFVATFGSVIFARVNMAWKPLASDSAQTDFYLPAEVEVSPTEVSKRPRDGGQKIEPSPKRPKPQGPNDPKRRMTRDEVLSDLLLRNATGRSFRSQEEAAQHYGVSPSRFSEWSKVWEAERSIPKRRKVGRCKQLARA